MKNIKRMFLRGRRAGVGFWGIKKAVVWCIIGGIILLLWIFYSRVGWSGMSFHFIQFPFHIILSIRQKNLTVEIFLQYIYEDITFLSTPYCLIFLKFFNLSILQHLISQISYTEMWVVLRIDLKSITGKLLIRTQSDSSQLSSGAKLIKWVTLKKD